MIYAIHPEAVGEFNRASGNYSDIRDILGQSFEDNFDSTLQRILAHPEAWHPIGKGYRRCSIKDFPFGIIYRVDKQKNCCFIYAVMHLHRKPGYWEDRDF